MATKRTLIFERAIMLVAGVYLAGGGIATLSTGRATHPNYMHAPASAAAAVFVGTVLIAAGTLGWRWLSSYL
jgi:hypothetical protein